MNRSRPVPFARPAFTLVELLVVIGIIAILLAILMPSLSKARDQSYTVKCLANHQQLMKAVILYSNEWDLYLPFNSWAPQEGNDDADHRNRSWLYNKPDLTYKQKDVRTGQLWEYLNVEAIYHCPSDTGPWLVNTIQNLTSYCMNGSVTAFGQTLPPYKITKFHPDDVLFWEFPEYKGGGAGNDGTNYPDEGIAGRHLKGATVSCIDGHAEVFSKKQWDEQLSFGPSRLWNNPSSSNGH